MFGGLSYYLLGSVLAADKTLSPQQAAKRAFNAMQELKRLEKEEQEQEDALKSRADTVIKQIRAEPLLVALKNELSTAVGKDVAKCDARYNALQAKLIARFSRKHKVSEQLVRARWNY